MRYFILRVVPRVKAVACLLACWLCGVFSAVAGFPPTLTVQPTNQTVQVGGTATFVVAATSGTTLSYQWYFQTAPLAGATNSTYLRTNAQLADAGAYYAAVQNADGTVNTTNAILTLVTITTNGSSASTSTAATNSLTWSHTVNGGNDRALFVGLSIDNGITATGVNYGAQPMTLVGRTSSTGKGTVELWSLVAPPVGTANVVATISSSQKVVGGAATFNGVNQGTPTSGSFTGTLNKSANASHSVASAAGELVMGVLWGNDGVTATEGGGQTPQWSFVTGAGSGNPRGVGSTEPGAASVTMSWTLSSTVEWVVGGVSIKPVLSLAVTTTNNSGAGSLRQAILNANSVTGTNTITFNIPGGGVQTITPASAFPTITKPIIIDGWSQPGFAGSPLIELNGTNAGANISGLTLGVGSSGSTLRGLVINRFSNEGVDIQSSNNVVVGNFLGTDPTGLINRGNANDGIEIANGANNTIGGLTVAERNIISGNGLGIRIAGSSTAGNVIVGNFIGANADGVANLGNKFHGVFFSSLGIAGTTIGDPHNNRLGGTTAPEANLIVNNGAGGGGWDGVSLRSSAGIVANAILGNSIYANGDLGIDFGNDGVTANDAGDADTGPNNLQNFPVLTSAKIAAGNQVTVVGSLNSLATNYFRVEFFASTAADATGYGEGQRYLGFTNLTTAANGNVNFTAILSAPATAGEFISATATKCNSSFSTFTDTSEFASNVSAIWLDDVATTLSGSASVYAASNFTYTITVANLGTATATNVVVSNTLPAGIKVAGVSGGGVVVGGGPGQVVFNQASSNNVSGVTNWTHVTTAAPNRLLLVGVSIGGTGAVSTITYGGANLTKVLAGTNSAVASELWQLVNPPSGTNTVAVTLVGTYTMLVAGAATYSGVDQAAPLSTVNAASGFSATASVTLNSATNEIVFDTLAVNKNGLPAAAAGQTNLWSISASGQSGAGSLKPGANSVTMSWQVANGGWVDLAASVKAAGLIGVVNWTIPTLASGATTNFTITVTAPLGGTLSNSVASTATSPDANPANNDGSAPAAQVVTTVIPVADIVTVQSGPLLVMPLTNYSYTVTVSNAGPCIASNVVTSESLSPMLTYVSSSAGGSYLAGAVTWPAVASLPSGFTTNFTVTVRAPISGTLTNTAASTSVTTDLNPANNNGSAVAATVITAVSPLQIANTSFGANVQTLNWSHTIAPGSSRILIVGVSVDVTNATVSSATFAGLPTLTLIGQTIGTQTKVLMYRMLNPQVGTYPISISLNTAAGVVAGACSFNGVDQANPVSAFVGNMGSGTNASLNIASVAGGVVIDAVAPKSPQNAIAPGAAQTGQWNLSAGNYSGAGSSSYGAATVSPSWALNSPASWVIAAVALKSATVLADVTVSTAGPASVLATSNLTYTITVTNLGSSTASNVVVSDVLPAGAIFVSASSGGTNNGGVVTWPTLVNFINGARTNYTVTITAPANGTLTSLVYSTSITADPDPSNNNGTSANNQVVTAVTPLADVATTVTGPTGVFAGENFSYTVTLTNAGPSAAGSVLAGDTLPAGAGFVSASDGGTLSGGVVNWSLASLASGASASFTVTVTAAGGTLTNTVASTAADADPSAANNNGSAAAAKVATVVYPRPTMSGQRQAGGGFQLQFATIPGTTVAIEASTNLVDWQTLVTTNSGSGTVGFLDQTAAGFAQRFYRSRQVP